MDTDNKSELLQALFESQDNNSSETAKEKLEKLFENSDLVAEGDEFNSVGLHPTCVARQASRPCKGRTKHA